MEIKIELFLFLLLIILIVIHIYIIKMNNIKNSYIKYNIITIDNITKKTDGSGITDNIITEKTAGFTKIIFDDIDDIINNNDIVNNNDIDNNNSIIHNSIIHNSIIHNTIIGGKNDRVITSKTLNDILKVNTAKNPEYLKAYNKYKDNNDVKLLFTDIKGVLKYNQNNQYERFSLHNGQRKLFLSELEFLTLCYDNNIKNDKVNVVYAGAAPSNKTYQLLKYFPNIRMILVDPNPFDIFVDNKTHFKVNNHKVILKSENESIDTFKKIISVNKPYYTNLFTYIQKEDKNEKSPIYIINDYFTDELANDLSKSPNFECNFISDIRTNLFKDMPLDLDIIWNMSLQYNWINIMKPKYSYIKFRHLYFNEDDIINWKTIPENMKKDFETSKKYGIDFEKDYINKKLKYCNGMIYNQAFAPISSTESRLFIEQNDINNIIEYVNYKIYEDTYCYYNNIERTLIKHSNKYVDKKYGIDHCADCALEAKIWELYKEKIDNSIDIKKEILNLSNLLHRSLLTEHHGNLF